MNVLILFMLSLDTTQSLKDTDEFDLLTGTYKLDSSQNFESYLKELGIGYFLRKLALLASPTVTTKRLTQF